MMVDTETGLAASSQNFASAQDRCGLMVKGEIPMPDHYCITKTCKHNHGFNGQTVRYIKSHKCIVCSYCNARAKRERDSFKKNRPLDALHEFEDRKGESEDDPLFD